VPCQLSICKQGVVETDAQHIPFPSDAKEFTGRRVLVDRRTEAPGEDIVRRFALGMVCRHEIVLPCQEGQKPALLVRTGTSAARKAFDAQVADVIIGKTEVGSLEILVNWVGDHAPMGDTSHVDGKEEATWQRD